MKTQLRQHSISNEYVGSRSQRKQLSRNPAEHCNVRSPFTFSHLPFWNSLPAFSRRYCLGCPRRFFLAWSRLGPDDSDAFVGLPCTTLSNLCLRTSFRCLSQQCRYLLTIVDDRCQWLASYSNPLSVTYNTKTSSPFSGALMESQHRRNFPPENKSKGILNAGIPGLYTTCSVTISWSLLSDRLSASRYGG